MRKSNASFTSAISLIPAETFKKGRTLAEVAIVHGGRLLRYQSSDIKAVDHDIAYLGIYTAG